MPGADRNEDDAIPEVTINADGHTMKLDAGHGQKWEIFWVEQSRLGLSQTSARCACGTWLPR